MPRLYKENKNRFRMAIYITFLLLLVVLWAILPYIGNFLDINQKIAITLGIVLVYVIDIHNQVSTLNSLELNIIEGSKEWSEVIEPYLKSYKPHEIKIMMYNAHYVSKPTFRDLILNTDKVTILLQEPSICVETHKPDLMSTLNSLNELKSESQGIVDIRLYKQPGTYMGILIDNKILITSSYSYYSKQVTGSNPVNSIRGKHSPRIVVTRDSPHFSIFLKTFNENYSDHISNSDEYK